jgi:glucose/arabinose dehydrogenase
MFSLLGLDVNEQRLLRVTKKRANVMELLSPCSAWVISFAPQNPLLASSMPQSVRLRARFVQLLSALPWLAALTASGQQGSVAPAAGVLGRGAETVLTPMFSAAVEVAKPGAKPETVALRGMLVKSGDSWICYDTGKAAVAAIWTGASFDLRKTNLATYKGVESGAVVVTGEAKPFTAAEPGRWRGVYRHGDQVIAATDRNGKTVYELLANPPKVLTPEEAAALTKGGPPRWPETITTEGQLGTEDGSYVADKIPLPEENPWKSWIRPTGLDFFEDGRLALTTLGGDVWIASGLTGDLAKITWRRFAAGLREPMGLRIFGGKIVVGGRDQITRLHDLNDDGEADFYECVNAGRELVPNFHAFAYDLQTDRAGNFYFGTGGNQLGPDEPWHGPLFRVSADGATIEPIARGFRAPNGLTIGPDDTIYVAENQGQWIPSSKISRVRRGGFYGFVADPKNFPKAKAPENFDPPMIYLPMTWDNSAGGGAFCQTDRWGPYRGKMLHTSFGAASLFVIFEQRVGDISQAAAVKFPVKGFESGIHRARFAPGDGQLYVCGLKGWQSRAVRDGSLARVRYTGKPVAMPIDSRVQKNAIVWTFAQPLDRATAEDAQNYAGEQWNYLWHSTYGSPDVPPSNPKKKGRDVVEIASASLSADGRTVTLLIPGLQPVMQMVLKANLKTATGQEVAVETAQTINVVP